MSKKLLFFFIPLFLNGCVGSILTGRTEYLGEEYPDIRNVPERQAALAPRGLHKGEEKASRATDLKQLEQDWEKITTRNKALRERIFPAPEEE